jgi:GTPase SAR1 family protein
VIQLEQSRPGTPPPTDGVTGPQIVSPQLKDQFEILRSLLQRSLWLAEKLKDNDATEILRARMANLRAAALMVVVGEVKVGKSSFINALLREEICAVAPEPCTASIQELVFGAQREVTTLGQAWDRVYLPKEVLREISIVDTPGTNSIVRDHSTITQNYIPHSDLVVFVFSAANPHTQTAWELLTLIKKEWHRKMVFVLQQSDRASERELTANLEHVKQYARERQVMNPVVFTLSAQRELAGSADSGFAEFRRFLRYGIERGEVWRAKFEGSYSTIRTVMTNLLTRLRLERSTLAEERSFYEGLLKKVEETEARASALQQSVIGPAVGQLRSRCGGLGEATSRTASHGRNPESRRAVSTREKHRSRFAHRRSGG